MTLRNAGAWQHRSHAIALTPTMVVLTGITAMALTSIGFLLM